MKSGKFEIVFITEEPEVRSSIKYDEVCRYLLQKYFEGSEDNEGFGLSEGFNRGSGGERLFNTSTED